MLTIKGATMIDEKVLIAEIKRLKKEARAKWGWLIAEGIYNKILYSINHMLILDNSCNFGKNLQEESASDYLEKEINNYFKDWYFDEDRDIMVLPNHYSANLDDIKEIARHFANWQKEQLMKDADELIVKGDSARDNEPYIIFVPDMKRRGFKIGDKAKVVIIKDTPEYIKGVKGKYITTTK